MQVEPNNISAFNRQLGKKEILASKDLEALNQDIKWFQLANCWR